MSRFLFVVPPLTGHVNPTVSLGQRAGPAAATTWRGRGCRASSTACCPPARRSSRSPGPPTGAATRATCRTGPRVCAGRGRLEVPVGGLPAAPRRAMVAGVEPWSSAERPDVLVVDQQTLAGARRRRAGGPPVGHLGHHLGRAGRPARRPARRSTQWVRRAARSTSSVGPAASLPDGATAGDLRFSDHLVLVFTTGRWSGRPPASPASARALRRPVDRPAARAARPSRGTGSTPPGAASWSRWARSTPRPASASSPSPSRRWPASRPAGRRRGAAGPASAAADNVARAATGCPSWRCSRTSTPSCPTAATTPCARRWPTGCRWWWRRSATTSRWSPTRSCRAGAGVRVRFGRVRARRAAGRRRPGARRPALPRRRRRHRDDRSRRPVAPPRPPTPAGGTRVD